MSADGTTYTEEYLAEIVCLLVLQLVTSGVPCRDIETALNIEHKVFKNRFRWAIKKEKP